MKVVFVSNYFNHHQIPVSMKLYDLCQSEGGSYFFIQTQEMEQERVNMGWGFALSEYSFVKNYWEDSEACQTLVDTADVVVFGGTEDDSCIQNRLQNNEIVFRYSERLYKTGRYKFISPRGIIKKVKDHTRHQWKRVYLLCSGAYVPGDYRMVQAYIGKKYRYGYFPECKDYHLETLLAQKGYAKNKKISILWAARMIDWKHPELPILLAKNLKDRGYNFHLTMIGAGELYETVEQQIHALDVEDSVSLLGFQSPETTRTYMEQSDIFLVTSDRQEGWGAVVNEAMNSACVVIANRAIGAVPFLMKNQENGIVYKKFMDKQCMNQIIACMQQQTLRDTYATNAYHTIKNTWNPDLAATRLYDTMKAVHEGKTPPNYRMGPLSKLKY